MAVDAMAQRRRIVLNAEQRAVLASCWNAISIKQRCHSGFLRENPW
jgi:hypothetical protein